MSTAKALLLVILLAVGGWAWWHNQSTSEIQTAGKSGLTNELDYFVEDFSVTSMTSKGKPARKLSAKKMEHFRDTGITMLEQPYFYTYGQSGSNWTIISEQGELSEDGETLLLSGKVDIDRPAAPVARAVHISTSNLRIKVNQDYAETDDAVKIDSDAGWVQGVGMQAWLREPSRIKFLSQTRARYEVQ